MGSATIDVVPYNGALAVVDLLTPGQTILLGNFGATQSGDLTDVDGTLGPTDDGIATFQSMPITYIGSGTATPGVAVPLVGTVPLGASVDVVAFEAGGQVYFHYPDGPPDLTSAIADVIEIDATPYPAFTPVCFRHDTLISTPDGPRPADTLQVGETVTDIDGTPHAILWIGRRVADLAHCGPNARRRLAPVVIPAGLLHQASPVTDLRVSRNHLLLIRHHLCGFFHGADALFVPAAAFLGNGGWSDMEAPSVTYIHFMCARHVVVRANGMAAETFRPETNARMARNMVAAAPVLSLRNARFLISEIIKTNPDMYRTKFFSQNNNALKAVLGGNARNFRLI